MTAKRMGPFRNWKALKAADIEELGRTARELSWKNIGKELQTYIPGRMMYNKKMGKYPTISITGRACALNCDHCQRKILGYMIPAATPELLYKELAKAYERGDVGALVSGGSRKDGTLPWEEFIPTIKRIKKETRLKISVHTGLIDKRTAMALKDAGVDEFLIDVIGDKATMRRVYHLDVGMRKMRDSVKALAATGVPLIPHIVFGLNYGKVSGEFKALEMVAKAKPYAVVIVVLIPIKGSPMDGLRPPDPQDVMRFMANVRLMLPRTPVALSCARPTGRHREVLDALAVDVGVNRIAMPARSALRKAKGYGLKIKNYRTCCSKSYW
jgi:hypothetical protein